MKKDLKQDILKILKDKRTRVEIRNIKSILISEYGYSDELDRADHTLSDEISHFLQVLEGARLIRKEVEKPVLVGIGIDNYYYFELTAEGYKEFSPFYKKAWNFLNNDFAKLLSLVSILLSIIATWVSIHK